MFRMQAEERDGSFCCVDFFYLDFNRDLIDGESLG